MRLKGKVALITGASGGIGSATAEEFAREGARCIGVHYSRSETKAQDVLSKVKDLGSDGILVQADVSDPYQIKEAAYKLHEHAGRIDILVCFAGHPFLREVWFQNFEDLLPEQWRQPIDVDLLGSIYSAQAVVPYMKEQGGGRILFISSTPALSGDAVGLTYLVAKGGLLSLGKALARSLGQYKIRVNIIAPGSIRTPPMEALTDGEERELAQETALKRLGEPRDIAQAAVYLSSDDSSYQTGSVLIVDGGYLMR